MQLRIIKLTVLFLAIVTTASSQKQPSTYPGSVFKYPNQKNTLLSMDSYEKVKSFYADEVGPPRTEEGNPSSGYFAFFLYQKSLPDDLGVSVSSGRGRSNVIGDIFSRLKGFEVQGIITNNQLIEIERKYRYLRNCYFVYIEDEKGVLTSEDRLIFRKYENTTGLGWSEPENQNEIMQQIEALMSAGRISEGMELAQKMKDDIEKGIELRSSNEAVKMWTNCLDEISAKAYRTMIIISM
ncbi:hypothetical protein EV194_101365 [Natronoflexus pectinivorans]|uniref:Uncharacterized protein n=2 Tax=Natronoflexus pectinivorans TaxID=682526 RepID=A0A4R2GNA3_9BACT|nr:hypothetical protein EV194_101365 [Natronoflexus pectinivorans]